MAGFFTVLSAFGVLVGLILISQGMWGSGLPKFATLVVGIFVTIKELLDMVFAK